ncbi:hypothetical protein [Alteromonas macleodii]|uniref:Uncharacterized protein n=1 Tax=Alteromonas macleodii TaxID=28108 RepID=A0AB36FNH9_ALTMA|nr:hypothetical protein [Alteromonas macleodii]OES23916.1 hypothetical protein BFV94_4964 [Alteromonas macleodii]OES24094.1 hypothetical protein BFV93_4847 [Alteromonas macleodii]OES25021.1 hypothetical protein BFV95_4489 [Alteromonas macleodii]OES38711.1 hypothetical protein BFV96_4822 [Alteromonas macleodii]
MKQPSEVHVKTALIKRRLDNVRYFILSMFACVIIYYVPGALNLDYLGDPSFEDAILWSDGEQTYPANKEVIDWDKYTMGYDGRLRTKRTKSGHHFLPRFNAMAVEVELPENQHTFGLLQLAILQDEYAIAETIFPSVRSEDLPHYYLRRQYLAIALLLNEPVSDEFMAQYEHESQEKHALQEDYNYLPSFTPIVLLIITIFAVCLYLRIDQNHRIITRYVSSNTNKAGTFY